MVGNLSKVSMMTLGTRIPSSRVTARERFIFYSLACDVFRIRYATSTALGQGTVVGRRSRRRGRFTRVYADVTESGGFGICMEAMQYGDSCHSSVLNTRDKKYQTKRRD